MAAKGARKKIRRESEVRDTKFDEYGMPHISPETAENYGCLLEPLMKGSDCPIACGHRDNQVLRKEMKDAFGLCMACWIPLDPRCGHSPPSGWTAVRLQRGESTTGIYAVPKKAVKSLVTLWKIQRKRLLSDIEYYQLRYGSSFYLAWEDSMSNRISSGEVEELLSFFHGGSRRIRLYNPHF